MKYGYFYIVQGKSNDLTKTMEELIDNKLPIRVLDEEGSESEGENNSLQYLVKEYTEESAINNLKDRISRLTEDNEVYHEMCIQYEDAVKKIKDRMESQYNLENTLQEKEKEVNSLREENSYLAREIEKYKEQINALDKKIGNYEFDISHLVDANESLSSELRRHINGASDLEDTSSEEEIEYDGIDSP